MNAGLTGSEYRLAGGPNCSRRSSTAFSRTASSCFCAATKAVWLAVSGALHTSCCLVADEVTRRESDYSVKCCGVMHSCPCNYATGKQSILQASTLIKNESWYIEAVQRVLLHGSAVGRDTQVNQDMLDTG